MAEVDGILAAMYDALRHHPVQGVDRQTLVKDQLKFLVNFILQGIINFKSR